MKTFKIEVTCKGGNEYAKRLKAKTPEAALERAKTLLKSILPKGSRVVRWSAYWKHNSGFTVGRIYSA